MRGGEWKTFLPRLQVDCIVEINLGPGPSLVDSDPPSAQMRAVCSWGEGEDLHITTTRFERR